MTEKLNAPEKEMQRAAPENTLLDSRLRGNDGVTPWFCRVMLVFDGAKNQVDSGAVPQVSPFIFHSPKGASHV